jgi:heme/copper-type cytochrome/quinol oxidase subunit 4
LVWGALLTTIGALLLIDAYVKVEIWILAVILLLVVVAIVLFLYMNKKEG